MLAPPAAKDKGNDRQDSTGRDMREMRCRELRLEWDYTSRKGG